MKLDWSSICRVVVGAQAEARAVRCAGGRGFRVSGSGIALLQVQYRGDGLSLRVSDSFGLWVFEVG